MVFRIAAAACALALLPLSASAHDDRPAGGLEITPRFMTDLPDLPGRESLMLTVAFPPGHESEPHRHAAHTFVYVLEGTVEMQVAGGPLQRLRAGDVFYETPDDVHTVARNASRTEPARILVLLLKRKGVAPVLPAEAK